MWPSHSFFLSAHKITAWLFIDELYHANLSHVSNTDNLLHQIIITLVKASIIHVNYIYWPNYILYSKINHFSGRDFFYNIILWSKKPWPQ